MKVIFTTNLDAYSNSHFPQAFFQVPRKGDMVNVIDDLKSHYESKNLPPRLEVVRVNWYETRVVCELWYDETDKKLAEIAGAKTL